MEGALLVGGHLSAILQYRTFLDKLELYVDSLDEDEMRSLLILRDFLSTKLELYKGVEMIVHLMASAATAMSVESLVESWISVYEAHNHKHRPISNDRAEKEISVAINGQRYRMLTVSFCKP